MNDSLCQLDKKEQVFIDIARAVEKLSTLVLLGIGLIEAMLLVPWLETKYIHGQVFCPKGYNLRQHWHYSA